jgi:hypothetical protein
MENAAEEAAKGAMAKDREEALHLQLQGQPPKAQQHNALALNCITFSRGPEMTLRHRSEEPACHKPGRSPLGMSHHGDGRVKELRKAHRVSDALPRGIRTGSGCRQETRPGSHSHAQPSGPSAIRKP